MYSEEKCRKWLDSVYVKEEDKEELRTVLENPKELEDRFYRSLEFGTAGLRGIMGMGTNRMNSYVVEMTTQALANYISKKGQRGMDMGVVIAYDSRNRSEEFARSAALVLAGNRIKTYLFDSLRAVPQLSFAIRHLGCISGIVITASHNPPAYNGYKVYWEEGYQITPEAAKEISEEIDNLRDFSAILKTTEEEGLHQGILTIISEEVDKAYMAEIMKGITRHDLIRNHGEQLRIVYTPLHGSGNVPVRRGLKEAGFTQVFVVEKQEKPDGNFPTVREPNPEKKEVFQLAMELGRNVEGDLLLGTDPDSDRLGVAYRDFLGNYRLLSGNEIGILLTYYLLNTAREQGRLSEKGVIIKSIVSTDLVDRIGADYGVKVMDVLTGFKFIGELMEEYARTKVREFLFGFEESYGYLPGTHCRDKDAIMTALVLSEMALHHKVLGQTLGDVLDEIYKKYGYCLDDILSMEMPGKEGIATIERIVDYFRKNMPMKWGERRVQMVEDYLTGKRNWVGEGSEVIGLPKSNVIKAVLDDQSWFCIRPSGTEPKIKIYFSMKGETVEETAQSLKVLKGLINDKIKEIQR